MNSYWRSNDDVEIWHLWWNKKGILPSSRSVSTTVWLYHVDVNKIQGEKGRWGKHKNTVSFIEQILPTALNKTASQLRHSVHCWGSKNEWIKRYSNDSNTRIHECWLTSKNLHSSATCRNWMVSKINDKSDSQ